MERHLCYAYAFFVCLIVFYLHKLNTPKLESLLSCQHQYFICSVSKPVYMLGYKVYS